MKKWFKLVWLGCLIISLVMLMIVWGIAVIFYNHVYGVGFELSDVEEFIEAELPTDATHVQFSTQAGIDRIVWLRFQTSEVNARQFINQIAPDSPLESEGHIYSNPPDVEWWQPTQGQPYRSVSITKWERNRFYRLVVVDLSSGNVVVYVEANDS